MSALGLGNTVKLGVTTRSRDRLETGELLQPLNREVQQTVAIRAVAQDRYIALSFLQDDPMLLMGDVTEDEKLDALVVLCRYLGMSQQRIDKLKIAVTGAAGAAVNRPSTLLQGA